MKFWRPQSAGFVVGGTVILAVAAAGWFILNNFQQTIVLNIGAGAYQVQVAATDETRQKGLSGRESLGPNDGLLFVFPENDTWKIWMKDMNFPIDIIWLDESRKVIYIVKDATPESGTDKIFEPRDEARYVLELAAGSVENAGIRIGQSAVFDISDVEVE
jgi:uncharacterized membrane protein (UPF0127 family)